MRTGGIGRRAGWIGFQTCILRQINCDKSDSWDKCFAKIWRDRADFAQSAMISRVGARRFDVGMEAAKNVAARTNNVNTIKHTRCRNYEKQGEQFEEI
jgi:hypothetical protein